LRMQARHPNLFRHWTRCRTGASRRPSLVAAGTTCLLRRWTGYHLPAAVHQPAPAARSRHGQRHRMLDPARVGLSAVDHALPAVLGRGRPVRGSDPVTTLTVIGGLPGTGKSTVSPLVAELAGAAFIRVDRIEQAIVALARPLTSRRTSWLCRRPHGGHGAQAHPGKRSQTVRTNRGAAIPPGRRSAGRSREHERQRSRLANRSVWSSWSSSVGRSGDGEDSCGELG
jgi:hypothetical protein